MNISWDNYLAARPDPDGTLRIISELMQKSSQGLRSLERVSWQMEFETLLRQRGLLNQGYSYTPTRSSIEHPSSLIRAVTSSGSQVFVDAGDVFLAKFVVPKLGLSGANFPHGVRSLVERLRRNEQDSE
jgi:hypothetical protein